MLLDDGLLRGSVHLILGNYQCVRFNLGATRSDGRWLGQQLGLRSSLAFGLIFDKPWLFEQGSCPVIYKPDAEFYDLPASAHAFDQFTTLERLRH